MLPLYLTNYKAVSFADDTALFVSFKYFMNMLYSQTNIELTRLADWFKANRLSLNTSKTNYMMFSPTTGTLAAFVNENIFLDKAVIERKDSCTFLGMIIDDKLCWNCAFCKL